MKKKNGIVTILFYVVLVALIIVAIASLFSKNNQETYTYQQLKTWVSEGTLDGKVLTSVSLNQNTQNVQLVYQKDGKTGTYSTKLTSLDYQDVRSIVTNEANHNGSYSFNSAEVKETPWIVSYLPTIVMVILFIIFMVVMFRQSSGGKMGGFGKSKAKIPDGNERVTFADVAGADEEKEELEEIVEFLKDPPKFTKLGAKIPHGVLLVGPPGTGKTLLAKAVAGEADVPFFSMSGSDFVEMYVGVGASRVRDLFDNARRNRAAIIFIDEIDAVGRQRGAGLGGGHDEREQTLNQLLVEMDGFDGHSGIIVLAATNRPDILDSALLRPGRFDRRVTVNYPDMKGREAILEVHCRKKPLEDAVDLHRIAQQTIGFTGADLANLMNEAALSAAKKGKTLIGMTDIDDAYMKLILGPQKKSKVRSEKDNRLCAYHEAGHAVSAYYSKHADPVRHITIVPAGNAGGVTVSVPTEDKLGKTRGEMFDYIVHCLGGRVAEEIVFDDISTGASSDIQQATKTARDMVTRYGMSDKLGAILYGSEHSADEVFLGRDFSSGKNYSEKTASEIDDEIRSLVDTAHAQCKDILEKHKDKLEFVAQFLLKNESMDEEQFALAMSKDAPTMEEIEAVMSERRQRSKEENERRAKENEENERKRLEELLGIGDQEPTEQPTAEQPPEEK